MKTLSIIVPLYNSEHFLPKCLDSLLSQDIPLEDYEIILVDDGSPDGSKAIAENYASNYPNIIVISQDNKGTSGARNTGLRNATGKYTYFVDPDDYILENSLRILINRMEEESLDVLRFGYTEVDEHYRPTKSCKNPESPDYSSLIMDGCSFMAERLGIACYVWTFLFRTSLLKDNGLFFYEGDYYDDTPWLPRVFLLAKRVDSIDIKRHFYLIRSNSLVQSLDQRLVRKKIDGQMFLICELTKQKQSSNNEKATIWYNMMVAHCALTLLTLVSIYDFSNRKVFLDYLCRADVYPLSIKEGSLVKKAKLSLINLSPELFCQFIHLKNR